MAAPESGWRVFFNNAQRRSQGAFLLPVLVLCFLATNLICNGTLTAATARTAVLLSVNDVYRPNGPDRGAGGGGLARLAALRARLEATHPDLLMLHSGDFLSPSLLGKTYKGEQMVDLMNLLDGNPVPGAVDGRMFAVFGNHEFDDTNCTKDGPLADRIRASNFTYLAINMDFQKAIKAGEACSGLHAAAGIPAGKILAYKIIRTGGLKLGLYGLTMAKDKYKTIMVSDPVSKSCEMVRKLRRLNVDAIVALTHLPKKTDLALLGLGPHGGPPVRPACTDYPDVVMGGHDHTKMALPTNGNPRIFKADADAISTYQVTLKVDEQGGVSARGINIALKESDDSDPFALARAERWFARHDELYCQAACLRLDGGGLRQCLKKVPAAAASRRKSPNWPPPWMPRKSRTGPGRPDLATGSWTGSATPPRPRWRYSIPAASGSITTSRLAGS